MLMKLSAFSIFLSKRFTSDKLLHPSFPHYDCFLIGAKPTNQLTENIFVDAYEDILFLWTLFSEKCVLNTYHWKSKRRIVLTLGFSTLMYPQVKT